MTSRPIKIAFCENGAGYGGAIISLEAFLEKIPAPFTPHIYTNFGTDQYRQLARLGAWRHLAPVRTLDPARLRRIPLLARFASPLENVVNLLPYALKYYARFKQDRIDLVYLNNDCTNNLAATLAARWAGLPTVLHARGFHADTRATRWVLDQVDHCIAVSHAVKDELFALGFAPARCTVVPEGLDLTVFRPRPPDGAIRAELGLSATQPIVTLVGGLVDWKGQDVLLAAAPHIFARFPQAHILLVGSAYGRDNRYAETMARGAAAPQMAGRVHMLGARQDIPAILAESGVVVHASTTPEPFGRTFLEAMALGRPTIASNEGGPLDVIEHELDGLLVPPRDPALLATAIVRLLSDPDSSARLGGNAADKARRYSIENHADMIGKVLHSILNK
jgi:glycosyltransferase involved in cell wall biosynthesis